MHVAGGSPTRPGEGLRRRAPGLETLPADGVGSSHEGARGRCRRSDRLARGRRARRRWSAGPVDEAPRNGHQLRRAGTRAHLGRCPARRLHEEERHQGGSRPPRGERRRQGRRGHRRPRRLVCDVASRSRTDAGRIASCLLRWHPLDEPRRDEQRAEHRDRPCLGRPLDSEARQGRAGDVRLRDRGRRRRRRKGRHSDLDVVGITGSRLPLRGRREHPGREDSAERLLPVHARGRGGLRERPSVGRLPLERERRSWSLRERHRSERAAGRKAARARVRVRKELDLPGQPGVPDRPDRRRCRRHRPTASGLSRAARRW